MTAAPKIPTPEVAVINAFTRFVDTVDRFSVRGSIARPNAVHDAIIEARATLARLAASAPGEGDVLAERSACAAVADELVNQPDGHVAFTIAARIRNRSRPGGQSHASPPPTVEPERCNCGLPKYGEGEHHPMCLFKAPAAVERGEVAREEIAQIIQREHFRPSCTGAALDDICSLPPKAEHYAAADAILSALSRDGRKA